MSKASPVNENNLILVESLMMEEAISSAQLEGATTTRKVAKEMLEKTRTMTATMAGPSSTPR